MRSARRRIARRAALSRGLRGRHHLREEDVDVGERDSGRVRERTEVLWRGGIVSIAARGLVPLVGEAPYQYTLYTHQIHFSLFRLSRGSYRSPKVPASFIDLRSEAT